METAGPGARGIVSAYPANFPELPGHVFNVRNVDGAVEFWDSQLNEVPDLGKWSDFEFLQTAP